MCIKEKKVKTNNILRQYRLSAGMTRYELSVKSGVSERAIQSYEVGQRSLKKASAKTVYSLARVLLESDEDILYFFEEVINSVE